MTRTNAIVIGRLIFAVVLLVLRWLIFEPILFVGVCLATIGEAGTTSINGIINSLNKANGEILNKARK